MKRFTSFPLLCVLFCILFSLSSFAANSTYYLDELGMSIQLPDDLVVVTRDTAKDEVNLSLYGLNWEDLNFLMLQQNLYIDSWDKDMSFEVLVSMEDSPLEDFNQLDNISLADFVPALKEEYKSLGITLISYSFYQHEQTKFMKFYSSQTADGATKYSLVYYTIFNGKAITITLHSFSGNFDAENESCLKDIVDSVKFDSDTDPQATTLSTQASAFTYTDAESGISFTVPKNWVETSNDTQNSIDAKFISTSDRTQVIFYTCENVWDMLSESEKASLTRDDVNNDFLTKADIAEMFNCSEENVTTVTYNEKEYFRAETVIGLPEFDISLPYPVVYLVHVENGYFLSFQFYGDLDGPYFSDFESMVESVNYPFRSVVSRSSFLTESPIAAFIIVFLFTFVVYSLPLIIYRHGIRQTPVEKMKALWITFLLGICTFLLVSVFQTLLHMDNIRRISIIIWGLVNYRILTEGKSEDESQSSDNSSPESASSAEKENDPADIPIHVLSSTQEEVTSKESTNSLDCNVPAALDNSITSQRSPQVFCKLCGTPIDNITYQCPNCGKQYHHIKPILLRSFLGLVFAASVALNVVQYVKNTQSTAEIATLKPVVASQNTLIEEQANTISTQDSHISDLEKKISEQANDISALESKIAVLNSQNTRQATTINNQKDIISRYENKVSSFDTLCSALSSGNVGYASSNFNASESIILVSKKNQNRKFILTAHWSNGGTVSVRYSSPSAKVDFDMDSWSTSTSMTVLPYEEGITVVTFSNSVNALTFKVIIIVTE